jgi:hypothetical protein
MRVAEKMQEERERGRTSNREGSNIKRKNTLKAEHDV